MNREWYLNLTKKTPEEADILKYWTTENSRPLVSICCATYNQENYIEDAIIGFLSQKTSFPFEIIINDDASTDSTLDVILQYASKYPNIIKVNTHRENQYSRGVKPVRDILIPQAKGKYIALCEGDDYWTASDKLEKQVKALEEKETCNICFSAGEALYANGRKEPLAVHGLDVVHYEVGDVVSGGGGFMPTASIMVRNVKEVIERLHKIDSPVGDVVLQILFSYEGGAIFIPEKMVTYRVMSVGSWSSNRSLEERLKHRIKMLKTYNQIANMYPILAQQLSRTSRNAFYADMKVSIKKKDTLTFIKLLIIYFRSVFSRG